MDIGAVTAAIQKTPSRATCLTRCHVSAGGGPGFKQGDIDPLQIDPPAGAGCAHGLHGQRGRRVELPGLPHGTQPSLRRPGQRLPCHGPQPSRWIVSTAMPTSHTAPLPHADINRHMSRVHCTVCHIPAFARNATTDMFRDFTKTDADTASNRYEPARTFATNVRPAYAWFNGLSYFYEFGKPITLQSLGRYPDGLSAGRHQRFHRQDPRL